MITLGRRPDGTLDFKLTDELDLSREQELQNFRRTLAELRTTYQISRYSDDYRAVPEYRDYLTKAINTIGGAHELSQCCSLSDADFISGVIHSFEGWIAQEPSERDHWSNEFSDILALEW